MRTIIVIIIITIMFTPAFAGAKAEAAPLATSSATLKVKATIEPSLSFSITGINNNTPVNTGNSGCPNTERTNTGFASSSTAVNLGILKDAPTPPNIAAQLITVTTNAQSGYVLSATSSGHLTNSVANYSIKDSPVPIPFPSGQQHFGIHPCGIDVPPIWRTGIGLICSTIPGAANICKYAWPARLASESVAGRPTQTESLTLASDPSGPSGNDITPGNGITTIQYAASIDPAVPGGLYTTVIRYLVTPTF